MAQLGVTLEISANQVLTKEGVIGHEAYLIVSGNAHCTIGEELEVAHLVPGDLFGEMSLLDGERRSATVIADTDMTAVVFNRQEFIRLVETSPVIALKLLSAMASRIRAVDLQLEMGFTDEK